MKILFIYTSINVRGASAGRFPAMQLGIAGISALLKAHGHACELLLVTDENYQEQLEDKINTFAPDIVAYTAVTTQFHHTQRLSKHVRQAHPDLFQICGGPHVTLAPAESLAAAAFDAVCVGEGEYPMLELVEKRSRGEGCDGIRNLYFRDENGRVQANEIRPFVEDLDALPFFDRTLYGGYVDLNQYPHCLMTTRGCNFNCSYCCNHVFKKLAAGKYVRSRSVENILAEIEQLKKDYPSLGYLYIEDETVGLNRKLWAKLLPALKRTGLKFGTNYRIGITGLDFMDKLRAANFVRLNIGIESGNEWIRRHVLDRRYTNEQIIETYRRARALGMDTKAYNLIGLPHETPEMFEDTIRINRLARPNHTMLNIFYPYPGTALDKVCDTLGLKPTNDVGPVRERTQSILNLPDFPKEKIMAYFNDWKKLVKSGFWARLKRMVKTKA